jgi:Fur family peroxide stress response transcriptional regulator
MSSNMEQLKEILQDKGLKPTFQRLRILGYLQKHRTHPTVEMIYEDLVREIPTISKTTIYNTLDTFLNKGIIHAVTITGTETRYDYESFVHHHFLCRRCGRVMDVDIQCPYMEKKQINGHRIEELHGYFKGICKECLKKKGK